MKYLVRCACGHAADRHEFDGCQGYQHTSCGCPLTDQLVIDAAVDAARSEYKPWRDEDTIRPLTMDRIVLCPCGHQVDQHRDRGCVTCTCVHDAGAAFDAAAEAVSTRLRMSRNESP